MKPEVQVVHERCCGVDVHKKILEACILTSEGAKRKRFATTTKELREFVSWLKENDVPVVAMESTGVYWKPVYNLLEAAGIQAFVVNAQHIKAVPGRKTDIKDAEWIAALLRHGLLTPSYIPERKQREMRELIRLRTAKIQERSREILRVQKILEGANIKLSSFVSDINGATSRKIIESIIDGIDDPKQLSLIAGNRLKANATDLTDALDGVISDHQRMLLSLQLKSIDFHDQQIAALDAELKKLEEEDASFKEALEIIDTAPGVGRRIAQVIAIEAGIDMDRFPTAKHLAAWAGMAPGNNESAGKRKSGKTRPGNPHLRAHLVQAAHTIARMKNCYLCDQYHRIAARRGKKRAAVAVGHSILISVWHMLKNKQPYQDLGKDYLAVKNKERVIRQCLKKLNELGVSFQIQAETA